MTPLVTLTDAFSAAECGELIRLASAARMKDAGLVGQTTAHQIRRAEIVWLDDLPETAWAMERLTVQMARANRAFGFDINDFGESAQIARYRTDLGAHFDWHADIGAGTQAARRKLTMVVQLSDPADYDGGCLEVRADSNVVEAPRMVGAASVFPSFTLHRVTPMEQGTRWSLTLWAHGPAFR